MRGRARGEVWPCPALTCKGHLCLLPVDAILGCARPGLGYFRDKGSLEISVVLAFVMLINSTRGCLTLHEPSSSIYSSHLILTAFHFPAIPPAAASPFACASSCPAKPAMCYCSGHPCGCRGGPGSHSSLSSISVVPADVPSLVQTCPRAIQQTDCAPQEFCLLF